MSSTTDPELFSLITNVCKPTKSFDFPETMKTFRLAWFEEFPWVCYSWWGDRIFCLPCVLFGHKNVENLYKRPCQTWTAAVALSLFLTHLLFLNGRMKIG